MDEPTTTTPTIPTTTIPTYLDVLDQEQVALLELGENIQQGFRLLKVPTGKIVRGKRMSEHER